MSAAERPRPRVPAEPPRVVDAEGARWRVREVPAAHGRGGRPDLVFESERAVRRVRTYPDDWRQLDDAALMVVSHGR